MEFHHFWGVHRHERDADYWQSNCLQYLTFKIISSHRMIITSSYCCLG